MDNFLVNRKFAQSFLEKIAKDEYAPPLSFLYKEKGQYKGVDYRTHVLQEESFTTREDCASWLENLYPLKIHEKKESFPKLREWMTIQNFMDTDAVDINTKQHAKIRHSLYKGENINAKLVKTIYDSSHDTMTYVFNTPATLKAHDPTYEPQKVDPYDDFKKKPNPEASYTMMIQVLDFLKWLKETRPEQSGKITWKEIKDVLDVAYVKIWCNCPSFHWFGKNYRATQFEASIYPTNIPDNKMRSRFSTYDLLCKHLSNLMKPNSIQFFLPQMASAAQKALRTKNLI